MTDSSRTVLLRVPVDEKGEPMMTGVMFETVTECDALGDPPHEVVLAALRAAPTVTEEKIEQETRAAVREALTKLVRWADTAVPLDSPAVTIAAWRAREYPPLPERSAP